MPVFRTGAGVPEGILNIGELPDLCPATRAEMNAEKNYYLYFKWKL